MELSGSNFKKFLNNFLYFRRELAKPENKQAKKIHSEEISYLSPKIVLLTFRDGCFMIKLVTSFSNFSIFILSGKNGKSL